MSTRNLSSEAVRDLFAQHAGSALFALAEFHHPEMAEPIYITNSTTPITYDGKVHIGLPFTLNLPDDVEERIPNLTMTVDNVERTLVELLRSVSSPPSVTMTIVRVDIENTVSKEIGPLNFTLIGHSINPQTVTLTIGYAIDILNEPATQDILNPGTAPGLF